MGTVPFPVVLYVLGLSDGTVPEGLLRFGGSSANGVAGGGRESVIVRVAKG